MAKDSGFYNCALAVAGVLFVMAVALLVYSQSGGMSPYASISTNMTNQSSSSCIYGYKCGIAADGCAVADAIYNCPNEPVNITQSNVTVAVNITQELNNSANAGFTLNPHMFSATSASNCSRQLISSCNNNVPSQFICVNSQYSAYVSNQYANVVKPTPCPEFLLAGTVSCGIQRGYCVVSSQKPN